MHHLPCSGFLTEARLGEDSRWLWLANLLLLPSRPAITHWFDSS